MHICNKDRSVFEGWMMDESLQFFGQDWQKKKLIKRKVLHLRSSIQLLKPL